MPNNGIWKERKNTWVDDPPIKDRQIQQWHEKVFGIFSYREMQMKPWWDITWHTLAWLQGKESKMEVTSVAEDEELETLVHFCWKYKMEK